MGDIGHKFLLSPDKIFLRSDIVKHHQRAILPPPLLLEGSQGHLKGDRRHLPGDLQGQRAPFQNKLAQQIGASELF